MMIMAMLSCSVEQLRDRCWEDRSIVSKASSKVVEARRSKLAHARAKGSVWNGPGHDMRKHGHGPGRRSSSFRGGGQDKG